MRRTKSPLPKKKRAKKPTARRTKYNTQTKDGFRSGLEREVNGQLPQTVEKHYEPIKLKWEDPAVMRTYTPDFVLGNGLIIEVKGIFDVKDRKKMVQVKRQYPGIEIRFVFAENGFLSPKRKDRKRSPNSKRYSDWCKQYGFEYVVAKREKMPCGKTRYKISIPKSWYRGGPYNEDFVLFPEPTKRDPNPPSVKVIQGPKI